jgi:hypothetical protein
MEKRRTRRYHVIVTEQLTFGVEEFDEAGLLRTMKGFLTEQDAVRWIETREEPGLGVHRARLKAELDTWIARQPR